MNTEKMREEFEAWAKHHYLLMDCVTDLQDGEYFDPEMQYAWEAWQASRESLVIELPKRCDKMDGIAVYTEEGDFYHRHDVREAIEAAGLKVKP